MRSWSAIDRAAARRIARVRDRPSPSGPLRPVGRPPSTTPDAHVDTNLLLAFLAGTSHPHHVRAVALLGQMHRGELRLIVEPVVVAECVWPPSLRWVA